MDIRVSPGLHIPSLMHAPLTAGSHAQLALQVCVCAECPHITPHATSGKGLVLPGSHADSAWMHASGLQSDQPHVRVQLRVVLRIPKLQLPHGSIISSVSPGLQTSSGVWHSLQSLHEAQRQSIAQPRWRVRVPAPHSPHASTPISSAFGEH
jgi:hypothetical protein